MLTDEPFCLEPDIFDSVLARVVGHEADASAAPLLRVRTRIDRSEEVFQTVVENVVENDDPIHGVEDISSTGQ